MHWIKVEDKLPPPDEDDGHQYSIDVLLYDGKYVAMGYAEFPEDEDYELDEICWHEYSHIMGTKSVDGWAQVTHWMFLPDPPLTEKD